MQNKGKINWLASYPKSGNTWVRIFLANLLAETDTPIDINELSHLTIASNRQLFDDYVGLPSSDLNKVEIERLRPYVYDALTEISTEQRYLKIHDAFIYTSEGRALIAKEASNKALYIIRNPLDVAVSFAHHLHVSCEKAIEIMCNKDYAFCDKSGTLSKQLEQKLLSWSLHVESWTQQKLVPVMVVKYEELSGDTENTFKKIIDYFEINISSEKFKRALQFSSFNELQKQELEKGFREKAPKADVFFRKGTVGSWKQELTEEMAKKIIKTQETTMKNFGYLKFK
jgi:hypothetical protein